MKIRTRYAPSPTGRMHVGNLRTALYAYLIAKHGDGTFILRIEDTDQGRFVEGATEIIYRTLEETGLLHDEGPDQDKGYGPYVQSERMRAGIYMQYAKQLVEKGEAYYCFCDQERLDSLKQTVNGEVIMQYDKHCLSIPKEEAERRVAAGEPFVIRQNNPRTGTTTFHDEIYGDITVDNSELDDMVLIKSDGFPTYNFANVVDDHLMEISHVVRGQEYLSSSPKYNRLYEAFGWEVPIYVHCPTITNELHQKLSKRSGHASFEDLIEQGFVSEAVVNFVALLGWSPEGDREIFSLKELAEVFDYSRISKSPAVFDMTKLRWMNGEYFKAMAPEEFYRRGEKYLKEYVTKPLDLKKIAEMVRTRVETFLDIREMVDFFNELPAYETELFVNKKSKSSLESSREILGEVLPKLEAVESWNNDALFELLKAYGEEKGYKTGLVMWPLRIALSGKLMTPAGATEIMDVLGKEESLARLREGQKKLGA
ncbi:glutamate--tRNA ligase [Stomatobaculum sp. F0698]|uniref:glutamate--tRNA ligase n=1 Tax=Stomatobaculum sp. F0698 TaxID=3059030 RepID=UPI00272C8355|nr:glutamate--tRNA ligase [Stomatobaculum sp. F0698]WLD87116.1 glutamate--tRNA ligase [Stomatobaculum sp. F0698]